MKNFVSTNGAGTAEQQHSRKQQQKTHLDTDLLWFMEFTQN